uniref:RrF2 family transcriptional regulator n=1 Tax=Eggerthella sinensis TaxID=242230 RepID=UPI003A4E2DBC
MDVTRRCDYACRILRAAYKSGESYVSVSDIAEQEDIPYAFARSIQHDLVKGGLIKTVRGARGGLALNCDPASVTLLEVLEAVQGPVSISLCVMDPAYCEKQKDCAYNKLWQGADRLLNAYFGAITLRDLIEQGASHPVVEAAMAKAQGSAGEPSAHCAAVPESRAAHRRGWRRGGCVRVVRVEKAGLDAWPEDAMGRDEFVELVRSEGERLYRVLPWRCIDDPYAVLVSEVMLQQTQVARVEKHWTRFLGLFPTVDALAAAGTADVLGAVQGLGYNALAAAGTADVLGAVQGLGYNRRALA